MCTLACAGVIRNASLPGTFWAHSSVFTRCGVARKAGFDAACDEELRHPTGPEHTLESLFD